MALCPNKELTFIYHYKSFNKRTVTAGSFYLYYFTGSEADDFCPDAQIPGTVIDTHGHAA
jgi:hypothetical protein